MNILNKLINSLRNENPYYTKLKKALLRQKFQINIKAAYFLFGIPDSEMNLKMIKKDNSENALSEINKLIFYDIKMDNIEIYFVEDIYNKFYLILLKDPVELWEAETIIEIIPVKSKEYKMESIYQTSSPDRMTP